MRRSSVGNSTGVVSWGFATPATSKKPPGRLAAAGTRWLGALSDRARPLLRHVGGVAKPKILGGGRSHHDGFYRAVRVVVKRDAGRKLPGPWGRRRRWPGTKSRPVLCIVTDVCGQIGGPIE